MEGLRDFENYFRAVRMLLPATGMRERRRHHRQHQLRDGTSRPRTPLFASKHALEAASEALVQEVKPFGIRVILIEPGVVLTAIFARSKRALNEASPYFLASSRLDRFFRKGIEKPTMPEAVAETIIRAVDDPRSGFRHAVGDDADRLNLKITRDALKEMRSAFRMFAPYERVRKVTVFGFSFSGPPTHPVSSLGERTPAEPEM